MKDTHEFEFDLESNLKQLYGENYEKVNKTREMLFLEMENKPFEIKQLRNIIQNPTPISKEGFDEWRKEKDSLYRKYHNNCDTVFTIEMIDYFIREYHLKEGEINS